MAIRTTRGFWALAPSLVFAPLVALSSVACTVVFDMADGELAAPDGGPDGASGTGGAAGSAGNAGTGGTAGTSGTGGTGGWAGNGGAAGHAGSSGSAGVAGSGGAAGTAGSSGTGGCSTDCDDSLPCTTDACVEGNCDNTLAFGCLILGECIDDGARNGDNACEVCDPAQNEYQYSLVANGTDCGAGKVCNQGVCGECVPGLSCTPSMPCHQGEIDCTSGTPVCQPVGALPNGTDCGLDRVCFNGECTLCSSGDACEPINLCRTGQTDCSTGVLQCLELGNVTNGTPCGANQVCFNGSCDTCLSGQECEPPNPCKMGITSCTTGQSTCLEADNRPNGTTCGPSQICQDGVCVGGCNTTTHQCVTPPGGGWSEPMAIVNGTNGCGGAFPTVLGSLLAGLEVPESRCECSCGSAHADCAKPVHIDGFDQPNCVSGIGTHTVDPQDCYYTRTPSHLLRVGAPTVTCGAGTVTAYMGLASWLVDRVACGAVDGAPCASAAEVCVPRPQSPFFEPICVMRDGDEGCPAGFSNRTLYHRSISDTRDCPNSCTCEGGGGSCQVMIQLWAGSQTCLGAADVSTLVTQSSAHCFNEADYGSVRADIPTVRTAASCSPVEPAVTGGATEADPVTVCCN